MGNTSTLKRLYDLCEQGLDQLACYEAISYLEYQLRKGCFSIVDAFLVEADAEQLSPSALLGIATITMHGRDHLTQREHFVELAAKKLVRELGEERAEKLLKTRR